MKTCPTYTVQIHIAGDLAAIANVCRNWCELGGCVSVTPTTFVFTGGSETGATVGLINYPRFPHTDTGIIWQKALALAADLLAATHQRSCTVVAPDESCLLENPNITMPR